MPRVEESPAADGTATGEEALFREVAASPFADAWKGLVGLGQLMEQRDRYEEALAEFERNLIRERTMAGLTAARARGRFGGRPKVLDSPTKIAMAQARSSL